MTRVHSGKRTPNVVAVFDVGSSSVGVGIAVRTDKGVVMPWSLRLSYAYQQDLDYTRFERSMLTALLEAGMRLTSEGIQAVQEQVPFSVNELQAICIMAPPWFIGGVCESALSKEKGIEVTEGLLENLEKEAQDHFEQGAQLHTWREVMGDDTTLIDMHAIKVTLDGYPVARSLGRKAHTVEVTSYGAHAPTRVLNEIKQVLQKTFPNQATEFLTSSYVAYRALELQGLTQGSLVLVELGGEMTTVSMVRNGGLTATGVFSQGTNHILREGFPKAKSYSEALGQLTIFAPGTQQEGSPALPTGLTSSLDAWHTRFTDTIIELAGGVTPPRNAVLICNEVWKEWFLPQIRKRWKQPGIREELGLSVVEQEGVLTISKKNANKADIRIASMLRGILTS